MNASSPSSIAARAARLIAAVGVVAACSSAETTAPPPAVTTPPAVATEPPAAKPVETGIPAVQYLGRFDASGGAPKAAWPGTRVVVRFDGTEASITLTELAEDWMTGGPSEWDVTIDSGETQRLVLEVGTKSYPLARGLALGPHTIELYRRSESQNGVTQIGAFDFGAGKLLAPPARKARRIEIIGDSAPAAFGIEGIGYPGLDCPGDDWASKWQNFHKSFGAKLGETFDAEVNGTVYSGKGMVKDIWRPDTETMPVIYERANPLSASSTFDLSSFVPDAIVIMLGGNDFAVGLPDETNGGGPATPAEFTAAMKAFVARLRVAYPSAYVLLVVSPSIGDDEPAGRKSRTSVEKAFDAVATAAADAHVARVSPARATKEELQACDGHGTAAFHARVAKDLAVEIRKKTGWN